MAGLGAEGKTLLERGRGVRASIEPRYGCQPLIVYSTLLERDPFFGWRPTRQIPRRRRPRHSRQQRTRGHSRPQRKTLYKLSRGSEMRTNSLSVPMFFPTIIAHGSPQAQVEVQLYQLEASYLTETTTNSGGNIITGFENYLKSQGIGRKKFEVTDNERMFSSSSTTYQRVRIV